MNAEMRVTTEGPRPADFFVHGELKKFMVFSNGTSFVLRDAMRWLQIRRRDRNSRAYMLSPSGRFVAEITALDPPLSVLSA